MTLTDFRTINEYISNGYPEMKRYGQHGCFWYGVKNSVGWAIDNAKEIPSQTFTFREIDLLIKALEPKQFNVEHREHAQKLSDMFFEALKTANEQTGKAIEAYSKTIHLEQEWPEEIDGTIATFTKPEFEGWMTSKKWPEDIKALHRKAFRGRILFCDDGYFEHLD